MDLSRLKELIELMNRHQLEELELQEENFKVRLRKQGVKVKEVLTVPAALPPGAVPMPTTAPETSPAASEENLISSPMVGTYYGAPSPEADPFVEVGDRIAEGTVLCIIEAMKVMNEVKAEVNGTIREILVKNGDSVEYGQPLFRL